MEMNSLANVRMFFKSLWNLILGGDVVDRGVKMDWTSSRLKLKLRLLLVRLVLVGGTSAVVQ